MRKGDATKARLVATTTDLIQRQGFGATGMSQILADSGTRRGSLYFHFPGGKRELVLAALSEATLGWRNDLQRVLNKHEDGAEILRVACRILGERLARSDWELGCPVATISLELSSTDEDIREICEEHLKLWEAFLIEAFTRGGMPIEEATSMATFALASIEGGLVLARTYQNLEPLEIVGERLASMVERAAGAP